MNQRTAKLINKAAKAYGIKSRRLKTAWKALPRARRAAYRRQLQQKVREAARAR